MEESDEDEFVFDELSDITNLAEEGKKEGGEHPVVEQLDALAATGTSMDVNTVLSIVVLHFSNKKASSSGFTRRHDGLAKQIKEAGRLFHEARRRGEEGDKEKAEVIRLKQRLTADKKLRELRLNAARFSRDKFAEYNKAMNPRSAQDCVVDRSKVEEHLKSKFAKIEVDSQDLNVPDYFPKVETIMSNFVMSVDDVKKALVGKKSKASPGKDGVTYAILREAMNVTRIAKYVVSAVNRVLDGTDSIPIEWREARIRLLFKGKGRVDDIDSYRPLAITSILGKALHAVIKDKILEHCRRNGVINEGVQKGFMPKVSGCVDHIAAMMNILRVAKASKKPLYALLLDLKAAYDSVNHAKLWAVLRHVGVSEQIVGYLTRLYSSSVLYAETKSFRTGVIPYGRGVLQGDTLSPLLFTIFFMVVIRAGERANAERGFYVNGGQYQHHLKAFADDLNVVDTSLEKLRTSWRMLKEGLDWCGLEVNAAKSRILVFEKGVFREAGEEVNIDEGFIAKCGVKEGANFLGLDISKTMDGAKIAELLKMKMKEELEHIGSLNYPMSAKLFFYEIGVLSKFRWWFTIYERVTLSTVDVLQKMAYAAFRSWGRIDRQVAGASFTSRRGFGIQDLRQTYRYCRAIGVFNGLKASDPVTVEAYRSKVTEPVRAAKDTELLSFIAGITQPPEADLNDYSTKAGIAKLTRYLTEVEHVEEATKLKGFGWALQAPPFSEKNPSLLKETLRGLNESELQWAFNALSEKLYTRSELGRKLRWGAEQKLCPLCKKFDQTLMHVLNGCTVSLHDGRYTVRHDAVLRSIAIRLKAANSEKEGFQLWVDLPGLNSEQDFPPQFPKDLKDTYRPDILLSLVENRQRKLFIIELTCPFETVNGAKEAHERKLNKYSCLVDTIALKHKDVRVELHCVEVGSRGYIANTFNGIKPLLQCPRNSPSIKTFLARLGAISLKQSKRIFDRRDVAPCSSFPKI